jgi:hypothetical protein
VYNVGVETKTCKDCGQNLPLTEFTKSGKYIRSYCRECSNRKCAEYAVNNREKRNERLKKWRANNKEAASALDKRRMFRRNYGLTVQQVEAMKNAQDSKCAICGVVTKLFVDHCHRTGIVRQMLCCSCNTYLGRIESNPDILSAIHQYLQRHQYD